MKKTKLILSMLVVGVLAITSIALAAADNQSGKRVYVLTNNSAVKAILGVNHEFPKGFSTKVSPKLKIMKSLGLIKTELVQIYQITAKPICGDGIIQKREECGEQGLSCPEGFVCENCKCVEKTAPPTRSCYPDSDEQTPWGIVKINGGSGGIYIDDDENPVNVKVAVLDTGVYKDHLDLKDNIVDCRDTTKRGIKRGCMDANGHGTHVAGTIAANGGSDNKGIYGVAPEAKIMAIKVCGPGGCWCDDIAVAIRYAADNGANIISMSLGGDTQSTLIRDAIDYAVGEGVLVVAAAGNDGPAYGSIDYPGANVNVIAVGAIDSNENVPSWSSRGINNGDGIIEEREVEFGAPGVGVESTWNNGCYNTIPGTSMATPHVAGLAAKLWQSNYGSEYTNAAEATRVYLQSIAKDIWITENNSATSEDERDDTATGFGLPIAL